MKVAVIGAAGGIGQALALLLKLRLPDHAELALYDIAPVTPGVAVDLSHIPTTITIEGHSGDDPSPALEGADVVIVSAGVARKPGMSRSDLFNVNASITQSIIEKIVEVCPKALVSIITNPVNTLVPIAAEIMKKAGVYDPRRLFGVTALDVLRAEDFVAELKGIDADKVYVPVVCGHSAFTIMPLLSQVKGLSFTEEEVLSLTSRIQNAGTEVVEAKAGGGSATLSMAEAGCEFALSLVNGLMGKEDVIEYAYVEGNTPYGRFFSQPVRLGKEGVEEFLDLGPLSEFEQSELEKMAEILAVDVKKGVDFIE
ncbi:malate dehydrogenase [Vibrio sp. HA2012]|uniref:malate dehydrogenase n=1 Tax=Vibrio sp. HA2012 TaxID=1971595 RepID=UPI000C2C5AEE|nr:malate dehydrogenase [Vibrio sp. HA2012]PJC85814.1 malate dehydrogenase [Vibrio sp. HA2012]